MKHQSQTNPAGKDGQPINMRKALNEKGALSIFTREEIEEFRHEIAKRSKTMKRRVTRRTDQTP